MSWFKKGVDKIIKTEEQIAVEQAAIALCLVADFETLNYKISQNYEQRTKLG